MQIILHVFTFILIHVTCKSFDYLSYIFNHLLRPGMYILTIFKTSLLRPRSCYMFFKLPMVVCYTFYQSQCQCYMLTQWVIILHVYYSVGHVTCKSFNGSFDICFILCHVISLINHITMLKSLSFSV